MLLIRRFEEKIGQLYGMGLIGGFCHLSIGEEAVAVGTLMAARESDPIMATHRCHGLALARGIAPVKLMAEFLGRHSGTSKGKGGSMHVFAPDKGFYGGHAIVGASVPLGTGLAFAAKYRGLSAVALVYYGDGAADQGQVCESFVMAKRWALPVLYICNNNQPDGDGESQSRAARGAAFGIQGTSVNGMDVFAVYAAASQAINTSRAGGGPQILEARTLRFRGHSMADPAKYNQPEDVQTLQANYDPLERLKAHLLETGAMDGATHERLERKLRAQIIEAAEFASHDDEPDITELLTDVVA